MLKILKKKQANSGLGFNFTGELKRLQDLVFGQSKYIVTTFKEYTPHDFDNHIKNLFCIAKGYTKGKFDGLLGQKLLEKMNVVELFVLVASIYGHDWGMAVNSDEKKCITGGEKPDSKDIQLLPDEKERFRKFAHKRKIKIGEKGAVKEIDNTLWCDYVRETHALRSGERMRQFFKEAGGGIGEAVARVCAGHRVNFEKLQDAEEYPVDYSVSGCIVNIRALAIYLRLLDLLDLADNRTPYVIWKFVAPQNPHSKMEWAKHRALHPVTFTAYQDGCRVIKIDGETNNHEVYAALEDLRVYCEEELARSKDILARMKHGYHGLDIDHIDWNVRAIGFKPISIRFEFDRTRMFEILSKEIYKGDPYIFLRELLQNSIDAIRTRRELLRSKGASPKDNFGIIRVEVKHLPNGDSEILWRDNGIGMDEYVIKNYLAIAGRSFYHSEDFCKTGLKIDPISQFGVGILSCFMVGTGIEIETRRDPHMTHFDKSKDEALRIKIPDMQRQYRVEAFEVDTIDIGTTVKIFVDHKKLPVNRENVALPLDVTAYLSKTAGFVEFPIVVTEGNRNTIILHPKQNGNTAQECFNNRYGKKFNVQQLNLSYQPIDVFKPQDVAIAKKLLRVESIDLAKDLKLKGFDGVISHLVPIDDSFVFAHDFGELKLLNHKGDASNLSRSQQRLRFRDNHRTSSVLYRDGLFLQDFIGALQPPDQLSMGIIPHKTVINIPKSFSRQVDLARTRDIGNHAWLEVISDAYHKYYSDKFTDILNNSAPRKRFKVMGRLYAFHNIDFIEHLDHFPSEKWPVPVIENKGVIKFLKWQKLCGKEMFMFPLHLKRQMTDLMISDSIGKKSTGPLFHWHGDRSFIGCESMDDYNLPSEWNFISKMTNLFKPTAVRFLHPPHKDDPPLPQHKCLLELTGSKDLNAIEYRRLLEDAVKDFDSLSISQRAQLANQSSNSRYILPDIIEFMPPFQNFFSYGRSLFNVKHPIVQRLISLEAWLMLKKDELPSDKIGLLTDKRYAWNCEKFSTFTKKMKDFWNTAFELGFPRADVSELTPKTTDFVPGTITKDYKGTLTLIDEPRFYFDGDIFFNKKVKNKCFGKPIKRPGKHIF